MGSDPYQPAKKQTSKKAPQQKNKTPPSQLFKQPN
jgi:hypothetical protein